jgi:hypothetical protein
VVRAIVTSSVYSSSGATVARPASVQDQWYSRALLEGYVKSLSFKKVTLPGRAVGLD